jgi:myo-inositol-1(or 4)-monophosphatase
MSRDYLAELGSIAESVARDAAGVAHAKRREGVQVAARKSTETDIVTFADQLTQAFIKERLAELRPQDAFFGEEGGAEGGTSGLTWVIDPIDGTVNYLYDLPQWSVSIAVVEGDPDPATWTALAGAVCSPVLDEMHTATLGGGAFLNKHRLSVNQEKDLAFALVGTGFAYGRELRAHQGQVAAALLPRIRDIRRLGSCSLDLCAVASGRLDAFFERDVKPWDHAAGALIAREAGAVVGGVNGAREGERLTIAANAHLFPQLEQMLIELGY